MENKYIITGNILSFEFTDNQLLINSSSGISIDLMPDEPVVSNKIFIKGSELDTEQFNSIVNNNN
ncbi:hypothetical protein [Paenibacillus polymyxa]|uniref:hypothetical protein n=1 Tax=Paenibacillus polymyxa TaxID=1406 RepID=UPI002379ED46|nr:hypothetical protein [Paenibacillus polymyxa]WDM23828.1 hypothetical protein J4I02_10230 [Paenibacillus polymyxa]